MNYRLIFEDYYLQKELQEAQRIYQKNSDNWLGNETLGRVLHIMHHPSSKEYFKKAAQIQITNLKPAKIQGWQLLTLGNYFRLALETDIAYNYFERAYTMLKQQLGDINDLESIRYYLIPDLITACFTLDRYEEVITYGQILKEEEPDANLFAYNFVRLAEARINNDFVRAQFLIEEIAFKIQEGLKNGHKIQDTGGIMSLDLYELAVEMLAEMESSVSS